MDFTSYSPYVIRLLYNLAPIGEVSELVDELDLGSSAERRVGSSPSFPTRSPKVLLIYPLTLLFY